MSAGILNIATGVGMVMFGLAMGCAAFRIIRGPRAQDRILGMDSLYLNGMLLIVVYGVRTSSELFFEAALIIGMLGFAATVALAKFLMRGQVIE